MGNRSYYLGLDRRGGYLSHYGVGHDKGGHSGRYPWGSGKNGNKNGSSVNDRPTSTPGMTKDEAIKRGSARDVKTFRGELTNKELQDVITRLKLEEQLDEFDSKAKSIGKQKAWQLLDKIGDQLVVPLAVGAGSYGLRTAVKVATKKFDLDDNLDMLYKELFKRVNPDPKKK